MNDDYQKKMEELWNRNEGEMKEWMKLIKIDHEIKLSQYRKVCEKKVLELEKKLNDYYTLKSILNKSNNKWYLF
jgi:hypothetical protein